MTKDSTPDGVSIEITPFDLATVTSALTVSETMLATAETSILELGKRLFVDGIPASELNQADYIGATVDMISDVKTRIAAVKNGLNAAGGVS